MAGAPTLSLQLCTVPSFPFGNAWPLHDIHTFIFHNPVEDPTICFLGSSSRVCIMVLLNALLLHAIAEFQLQPSPLMHPSFRCSSCNNVLTWSVMNMYATQCRNPQQLLHVNIATHYIASVWT